MKHIQAWLLWVIGFWLIRLSLMILGFVVFPIAYYTRKKDDSLRWLFWLWGNEEDGIYGAPFWIARNDGKRNFKTAYTWSVLRNPVNNMRFTWMGIDRDKWEGNAHYWGDIDTPNPRLARTFGGSIWHYSLVKYNGIWYPSFWYIRAINEDKHFRVRMGWKCTHKWMSGEDLSETGLYSGITFQFLPYRNG